MTAAEREKLRELAKASAQGADKCRYFLTVLGDSATQEERQRDADYMNAANPAAVLSLLDRIAKLEGALTEVVTSYRQSGVSHCISADAIDAARAALKEEGA